MKYQIWDKTSNIITPNGQVFTPIEWIERYPMCGIEGIKTVIGGGIVNGTVCMEFTTFIEAYQKNGCDFSACETEQEILDAIEAFENAQNARSESTITDQTRIADALEDLVVMQELSMME